MNLDCADQGAASRGTFRWLRSAWRRPKPRDPVGASSKRGPPVVHVSPLDIAVRAHRHRYRLSASSDPCVERWLRLDTRLRAWQLVQYSSPPLEEVGGTLRLYGAFMETLTGLDPLTHIGGDLEIEANLYLKDATGLWSLTEGGLTIRHILRGRSEKVSHRGTGYTEETTAGSRVVYEVGRFNKPNLPPPPLCLGASVRDRPAPRAGGERRTPGQGTPVQRSAAHVASSREEHHLRRGLRDVSAAAAHRRPAAERCDE